MRTVDRVVSVAFLLSLIWLGGAIYRAAYERGIEAGTVQCRTTHIEETPQSSDPCKVTYGPESTPMAGWVAWGKRCPEGVDP